MTRNRAMVLTGVLALLCATALAQEKEDRTLLTTEQMNAIINVMAVLRAREAAGVIRLVPRTR